MWADVVLFDLSRVGAGPMKKVQDLPAGASRLTTESTGVEHVLNRGTEVVRHGQFTGDLPGRLLRSGRDTSTVRAR
jgi:N-acyl-D-aspartate/D-glutamate deacylase